MARIVLVRHGRSSHVHTGWVDATGFRAWREAYEAAGIRAAERVPMRLQRLLAEGDVVVSSDAPRAVSSARLLAPGREVVVSPLLRELALEGPRLGGLRLPLALWALAVAGRILLLGLRRRHPSAAEAMRIAEAARWLAQLADGRGLVVAVTHGSFRQQLARRLQKEGWRGDGIAHSIRPWSAWYLRRRSGLP